MSWHRCERWWAQGFACVYHREVPEEPEDEEDEDEKDPRGLTPIPVPAKRKDQAKEARAQVEEALKLTVPYTVAVEPPVFVPAPTGGSGQFGHNRGPVYVPAPGIVFEPLQDPVFIPPGGPGALVPGGLPPPPSGGGGFNVFDIPDRDGPSIGAVTQAIGIAIAATVAIVIVARFKFVPPSLAKPIVDLGGRLPPLPFFPVFEALKQYSNPHHVDSDLALAERAVIESINTSFNLAMEFEADYKERQLQDAQTARPDEPVAPQANSQALLFNAINRMADLQLPGTAEFDWRSVGLSAPP